MLMSKAKCNVCNTFGHVSNNCTESWRQFHNTVSFCVQYYLSTYLKILIFYIFDLGVSFMYSIFNDNGFSK